MGRAAAIRSPTLKNGSGGRQPHGHPRGESPKKPGRIAIFPNELIMGSRVQRKPENAQHNCLQVKAATPPRPSHKGESKLKVLSLKTIAEGNEFKPPDSGKRPDFPGGHFWMPAQSRGHLLLAAGQVSCRRCSDAAGSPDTRPAAPE